MTEERRFTITKFERHADGYFHARVTMPGGKPLYVHTKAGRSWLAPGNVNGRALMKEVPFEVKAELVRRQRAAEKAERKARGEPEPGEVTTDGETAVEASEDQGAGPANAGVGEASD